ncbi:MAG: DNA primase [Phycisphaerales bacterium]|nr:DNA primase [Phycisphaerales bacterium]
MNSLSDCRFGYRIVGPCSGERRLIDWWAAFNAYAACDERARCDAEAYLSSFTFDVAFRDYLTRTSSTKGYAGECGAPFLWWDIDRDGSPDAARTDAAKLALAISDRFAVAEDDLLAFYSGSKGFHLGLPVSLWEPPPSADFHRIARRFCEVVADAAGVVIDTGIYDAVRALRAPNSRHPKTGLHKRRLPVEALMHLDAAAIMDLAKTPEPFDVPTPPASGRCDWNIAADWSAATEHVRNEAEAKVSRRAAAKSTAAPMLNRLTLAFIRDGADTGDRHRLLYSAARNLGELGCPLSLAVALLTESALDSGLPPADVRRQIECGLKDAVPSPSDGKGGAA